MYCSSGFQMLTSHRLSLSFYFCFHDNVMMMFYVTMQWVKWLSVSSFVVGLRLSNPRGEQHKKLTSTKDLRCETVSLSFHFCSTKFPQMEMRSNWSPWQQSKILSCLLLVDVVIIMLIQITVICASMYRNASTLITHLSSLPPLSLRIQLFRRPRWSLL